MFPVPLPRLFIIYRYELRKETETFCGVVPCPLNKFIDTNSERRRKPESHKGQKIKAINL